MAEKKKRGFMSWLGFGRKNDEQEDQQKVAEEARLAAEAEAKAQAEEQVRLVAEAEAKAKAQAEEQARLAAEAEAKAQAEEQARLVAEAEAKAQAEEQARLAAEADAKAQAEEQARLAAEAEAKAKAQVEEQARLAAEAEAKAQAEEQARLAAEAEAKAQAEEQARLAAEAEAKAQAEEQARLAAEAEAKAQAEEQARLAAEAEAKAQAEEEARLAAEAEAKAQAEEQARLAAEAEAKAQAEEAARLAAEAEAKAQAEEQARLAAEQAAQAEQEKPKKEGFFARLKRGLQKTKVNLGAGFFGLFSGKKIDDELFEELEEQLLIADVGMDTTTKIIDSLTDKASRKELKDGEALYGILKQEMADILTKVEKPLDVEKKDGPFVILMVGVNGVGKTTTIGKLAKQFQQQGKSVMLAAGDTFRAAAVEQLQVWGDRNNVPVIAQHTGADSASVIYDAIEAAKARNVDVVIADTAGRLQNKANLMEELKKIVRVMKKLDENAPHEIMLTIDAGTGQNAISQARLFNDIAPLSGITLTKLDGTAKGGVIFAVADQFNIPIRFIGVGEGIDDLRPFVAEDFIEALFSQED
ncbi:signal recognition particle-docking protein FtsY [Grimontia sp. NTOU-MAR1]|uniref:signal recognition particle-docking protein FtsY n=1 Tax=Grimontia sp. NTOU-MAR1 TaxID=3111011 RepID=UPI002DB79126|nr:signal recognition particle-docking protein FtsY [Grimontia sp. NTOU-MAR1]WRV96774.1 signal recognition particle-docking protein FtsY [Grimontia sp. NTOU-MAR1]